MSLQRKMLIRIVNMLIANRFVNNRLSLMEQRTIDRYADQDTALKPIFLIGPPRSGTTLVYQMLINRYQVSYLNNMIDYSPETPALTMKLTNFFKKENKYNYRSKYGYTEGLFSPNEGQKMWDLWFSEFDHYAPSGVLTEQSITNIRRTVTTIENITGKPFINKYPRFSVRLEALNEVFPEAVFIFVTRESLYNAQSLIRARKDRGTTNIYGWWGIRPPEYQELRLKDICTQAAGQVYYAKEHLKEAEKTLGDRVIAFEYEKICKSPRSFLAQIDDLFKHNDVKVEAKTAIPEFPKEITVNNQQKIPDDLFELLREKINMFESSNK